MDNSAALGISLLLNITYDPNNKNTATLTGSDAMEWRI